MMKEILKRKFKKKIQASVFTYVMIMFGLVIVFYLMGFESPYTATVNATAGSGAEATNIYTPTGIGVNILNWVQGAINALFTSVQENPILAVIGTVVTIFAFYVISKVGGQFALTYIIPALILAVFLNIFVFPTATLQADLIPPFDIIVFGLFNLFLILSVVEFVRGSI